MKKKKIMLVMVMIMASLAGCNKEAPVTESTSEYIVANNDITIEKTDTESHDTANDEVAENEALTNLNAIEESDETDLNLKEYKYSFEDRKVADEGEPVFYLADFEDDAQYLELEDSVSLYAFNGKCVGHTKENININTIGRYGDWYYLMLDRDYRFMKVADVDVAATDMTRANIEELVSTEAVTPEQGNEVATVAPALENVPDVVEEETAEAPVQSNKYTPEEAIAVYRSLMEAGGITWDPSLKGVTSWGTGWIYLDRGQPEWAASTDLESFAMGDSVGHAWTKYYLEVTGSDENAVYITAWSSN